VGAQIFNAVPKSPKVGDFQPQIFTCFLEESFRPDDHFPTCLVGVIALGLLPRAHDATAQLCNL